MEFVLAFSALHFCIFFYEMTISPYYEDVIIKIVSLLMLKFFNIAILIVSAYIVFATFGINEYFKIEIILAIYTVIKVTHIALPQMIISSINNAMRK